MPLDYTEAETAVAALRRDEATLASLIAARTRVTADAAVAWLTVDGTTPIQVSKGVATTVLNGQISRLQESVDARKQALEDAISAMRGQ